MLGTLAWVLVGAFIGWNLPQPSWAKAAQEFVKLKWHELVNSKR